MRLAIECNVAEILREAGAQVCFTFSHEKHLKDILRVYMLARSLQQQASTP